MSFAPHTAQSESEILASFDVTLAHGLPADQVAVRLKKFGHNYLSSRQVSAVDIFVRQFKSSFIYLLIISAALALFLGQLLDGILIAAFVLINSLLSFYQEYRSEQTIKLLGKYLAPRARVIRDSLEHTIDARDLVPGDILILEAGDRIPADVRFVDTTNLLTEESVLTGESAPVPKTSAPHPIPARQIFHADNIGFSGTSVVSGKATAVVIATGQQTTLGDIASLTAETKRVSGFEIGLNQFSNFIVKLVVITLAVVVVANLLIKGSPSSLPTLVIFAITLAVSAIPEGLPVVTTFALSRGARNLAKNKVVVKRLSAIEDLGSIEILCSDKTGTLTQNQLSVNAILPIGQAQPLLYACLAAPFLTESDEQPNNAFDLALKQHLDAPLRKQLHNYQRLDELPFDPQRRRNSVVVRNHRHTHLIVRGAPEEITKLCTGLSALQKTQVRNWIAGQGSLGHRVIAVGHKLYKPTSDSDLSTSEHHLTLAGLISFVDPLKPTTQAAITQAEQLGVAIKILTGDDPHVAGAVAHQINLISDPRDVITGEQLEKMSTASQRRAVQTHSVFARVSPRQKYHIIQLLQEKYQVGFLGEGINDAPALKLANVALVVHEAADIARDAADIVLLDNSLGVIVNGIQQGREVFANTIKYIKATLSSNLGNFYAVSISSFFIPFLPMLPIHILLLNLLSDFPMIAIATDTVDKGELQKPTTYRIKEIAFQAIILGVVSTVFDFIVFGMFFRFPASVLQTNWFMASIFTELLFLFSVRTRLRFFKAVAPSRVVIALTGVAFLATLIIPYTSLGQEVFKFTGPSTPHLTLILLVAGIYFATTETVKLFYFKYANNNGL